MREDLLDRQRLLESFDTGAPRAPYLGHATHRDSFQQGVLAKTLAHVACFYVRFGVELRVIIVGGGWPQMRHGWDLAGREVVGVVVQHRNRRRRRWRKGRRRGFGTRGGGSGWPSFLRLRQGAQGFVEELVDLGPCASRRSPGFRGARAWLGLSGFVDVEQA